MAELLTEQDVEALKEVFGQHDKEGDGLLSTEELEPTLESAGFHFTPREVTQLLQEFDADGNAKLDFKEFLALISALLTRTANKEEFSRMFTKFDKNGDGFVSKEELREVLAEAGEAFTPEEIDDMVRSADTNADGRLDYNEFITVLGQTD